MFLNPTLALTIMFMAALVCSAIQKMYGLRRAYKSKRLAHNFPIRQWKPGERIDSDIELVERIAQTNYSEVWKVKLNPEGLVLAAKRLVVTSQDHVFRELAAWAAVNTSPFISRCAGFRSKPVAEGMVELILFSEYYSRGSLKTMSIESAEQILDISLQIATALDCIHGCGLVHGDIKPTNVMLSSQGHVSVIDFGLTRPPVRDGTSSSDSWSQVFTRTVPRGTPKFASPEQRQLRELTFQSDMWSWAETVRAMYRASQSFELPPQLMKLLAWCQQDSPDARPGSMTEIIDVLNQICRDGDIATNATLVASKRTLTRPRVPAASHLAQQYFQEQQFNHDPPGNAYPTQIVEVIKTRAQAHMRQSDYIGAIFHAERALSETSSRGDIQPQARIEVILGDTCALARWPELAAAHYMRALELAKGSPNEQLGDLWELNTLVRLGITLMDCKEFRRASDHWAALRTLLSSAADLRSVEESYALRTTALALMYDGVCHDELGNDGASATMFQQSIECASRCPKSDNVAHDIVVDSHFCCSRFWAGRGEVERARDEALTGLYLRRNSERLDESSCDLLLASALVQCACVLILTDVQTASELIAEYFEIAENAHDPLNNDSRALLEAAKGIQRWIGRHRSHP